MCCQVIADLRHPRGVGDKRILRIVASMLGLGSAAAQRPKRSQKPRVDACVIGSMRVSVTMSSE